eukprot:scaffold12361_cov113-Isochrysis_galbana.AAC.4
MLDERRMLSDALQPTGAASPRSADARAHEGGGCRTSAAPSSSAASLPFLSAVRPGSASPVKHELVQTRLNLEAGARGGLPTTPAAHTSRAFGSASDGCVRAALVACSLSCVLLLAQLAGGLLWGDPQPPTPPTYGGNASAPPAPPREAEHGLPFGLPTGLPFHFSLPSLPSLPFGGGGGGGDAKRVVTRGKRDIPQLEALAGPGHAASGFCGEQCTVRLWNARAGLYTCGQRVAYLKSWEGGGHGEADACRQIAEDEFPLQCGGCTPFWTTPLCAKTCSGHPLYAGDGICDDGGPGAEWSACEYGTD